MSGRQLDNWNGSEYRQITYSNQCAKPSKVTSRQIQANNRMAAAEVQQITRALSSNGGQPSTVTSTIDISQSDVYGKCNLRPIVLKSFHHPKLP